MRRSFRESGLDFTFGDAWEMVEQWDAHAAYHGGLRRFEGTRAVDFVGVMHGEVYLIEVKSFRQHRIENKPRLASGALAEEVADKVRDTLAGVVWAEDRAREHRHFLQGVLRPIFITDRHPRVVLWLEEDLPPRPADRSALASIIKTRLRWLTRRVMVVDRTIPLDGITVVGVPDGP